MSTGADPLAGLRDLHTPPPPSWWPPAPGWWLLAALALAAVAGAVVVLIRRRRRAKPVRAALAELEAIFAALDDGGELHRVQSVSTLLKRVALLRYPRTEVAALSGERWVTFLQNTAPRNADPAAVEALVRVHATRLQVDGEALRRFSRDWLLAHRVRGRRHADV